MPTSPHLRTLGVMLLTGANGEELLRRRIDLALLTVLADRTPEPVSRAELQTLFWGEREEKRAQHSLRQVILRLRQALGNSVEVKGSTLRLLGGSIEVDVRAFALNATAGRYREAIALWGGVFLPECEDIGIDGFRVWLDGERERLRRQLLMCFDHAVRELTVAGDLPGAAELSQRWIKAFPLEENAARAAIENACEIGALAVAFAERDGFVRRLREELGAVPANEWITATDCALRNGERKRSEEAASDTEVTVDAAPAPQLLPPATLSVSHHRPPLEFRSFSSRAGRIAAVLALLVLGGFTARKALARSDHTLPLAVGSISSPFSADTTQGFATLLTIDLARIGSLNVISERRLSEVGASHPGDNVQANARSAGAREMIEGVLTRPDSQTYRADLRRVDVESGDARAAYAVEARNLTELADLITEAVARDHGVPVQTTHREGITSSIVAYRFYEQGLREYFRGNRAGAHGFLARAVGEDSLFAMATFYLASVTDGPRGDTLFERASRLAQSTSERERLVIGTAYGHRMNDPRVFQWAETLITRYPSEPEPHLIYAGELLIRRNYLASLAQFKLVVGMDSLNRNGPTCRACEGLVGQLVTLKKMDSTASAEGVVRRWISWQPLSPGAWSALSEVYGATARYREAHVAIDSVVKYSQDPVAPFLHTVWWLRQSEFARIDDFWRSYTTSPVPDVREEALWTGIISLRTQGRIADARALARKFRQRPGATIDAALPEAVTLMEAGQPRVAASIFDSLSRTPQPNVPSRVGASRAVHLTYVASALAMAGDTLRLRGIEDSVRVNGALATDRYKILYNYVHGLRLSAAGRHLEAAQSFRSAVYTADQTYVRIYLELAKSLLLGGRPADAIAPLRAALAGPTSATGLYATRTELQEMLGTAYERAGKKDSALVQYRLAANAWQSADAPYRERRSAIVQRIASLSR